MANLEIEIGAVTSGLEKALKSAETKLNAFGKKAQNIGSTLSKNLTAPIAAIGAASFAASVKVGNFADTLLDLEQQTGLSTDALQEYRMAANRAGIDTDTVARASQNLQRRFSRGEEGSKDLTDGLNALGVAARDSQGNIRGMDQIVNESITALAGFEDITQRNQLALKIFGQSASELAPLLALGADGIEDAKNQARELGLVLSKDALGGANRFREQFDQLKATTDGVVNEIGLAFLPVAEKLVSILQNNVVPAVRSVVNFFQNLSDRAKLLIASIGAVVAAIGPLLAGLGFFVTTILPALKAGLAAVTLVASPLILKIAAITAAVVGLGLVVKGLIDSWGTVTEFFSQLWDKVKILFIDGVTKVLEAFNKLTSVIGIDFKNTIDSLKGESDRIRDILDEKPVVSFGDVFREIGGSIKNTFTGIKDNITSSMGEAKESINQTATALSGLGGGFSQTGRTEATAIGGAGRPELGSIAPDLSGAGGIIIPPPDTQPFLEELRRFEEESQRILEFGVGNAIGDFAFSIGEALGSGANVLESAGQVLLGSAANLLNQLGQLAITTGITIGGIKKALLTLNPAVAIAAGAAAIALAGIISSKVRSLGATGGGAGGATAGAGTSFEGSGQNNAFVDSFSALEITGQSKIQGQDIIISYEKAQRANGR